MSKSLHKVNYFIKFNIYIYIFFSGLTQDSINIPTISNKINNNEFHCKSNSNSTSNHFLRFNNDIVGSNALNDSKFNGLVRPALTVRRYISGSDPNCVFSSLRHLNKKKQLNSNNFLYNTRNQNSISSKILLVHHNNNNNKNSEGILFVNNLNF